MSSTAEVDLFFENDLGVDLEGIPSSFDLDITGIPKISIGIDPITLQPITIRPLDVSVRLKEVPSLRTHVPANFTVGLSVLGYELLCVRLCGEAQVINEPYDPNPCEICGAPPRLPTPPDHPPPDHPVPVPR